MWGRGERSDSGTGVLLSAKERRYVLGQIGGGGYPYLEEPAEMPVGGDSRCLQGGAPWRAARQCRMERDKAADAQAEVRSVLCPCQQRMGLPGQDRRNAAGWRGYDYGDAGNADCLATGG